MARKRGVAVSSVVRRIDTLEADLQTKLFVRSTRALALTDPGEMLLARAQDVINRLIDTRSEIGALDETPSGILRISCLPTFGRLHILPVVEKLLDAWPDLAVELNLTERMTDPASERCDVAIRIGDQVSSNLIATPIGTQRWIVCAAPAYLDKHGRPDAFEDVAEHRRIGKAREAPGVGWSLLASRDIDLKDRSCIFRCDEFETQRQAAISGIGLAILPNWVIGADIAAGRLVLLFSEPKQQDVPILLLRALSEAPPKLRVFIEAVRRQFQLPKG